jgi:cell division transport system permease protein
MLLDFALPEHERQLIPEGRLSGTMPWVVAIMLFLTLLAAATGLILVEASRQGGNDLARQLTVQIIEADPALRAAKRVAVARDLSGSPGILEVKPVPEEKVRALLEPWLGSAVVDADIPVPALIDLSLSAPPSPDALKQLRDRVQARAPGSRIESHASWMAPFFDLMRALLLLIGAIVFLLLVATSATVVLAVRSALNTHRETIEIMHMMGGTDLQAARLFQRRVALDSLLGGMVGFVAAAIVIMLLGGQIAKVEPGLLAGASFPLYGWIVLALIPLAVTGLAMLMARMTVISALKKML